MEVFVSLAALTFMEIVLGIDNVVFIAVLADKLPEAQQARARFIGLSIALIARVILLLAIAWIMRLTEPLITVFGQSFSGKDFILLFGGLFLVGKASHEIFEKLEGNREERLRQGGHSSFGWIVMQIVLLDVVFSLDSVITAVGMVRELWMMITAVVIAMVLMLIFAEVVARFVNRHPSLKVLALSFLILIGVLLVAEGMHQQINRGYIYFAMFFSLVVELANMRLRKLRQ